jgi:hypothetical protein
MTPQTESLGDGTRKEMRRGWLLAIGVSLATSLAIVSPFFWLGSASGHDFGFHAASWLDAAGQWKEGIAYPRWTEWANYGFGEPRFIFYPPLSWMLGAGLSFVAPWKALPGIFIALVQTIAGLSAYALARRLLPLRGALFCAVSYAANPYALVVVYMRSDFAEQLATAFFPLLALLALEVSGLVENRDRVWRRSVALFGVVFATIWLSNAPAAVMASYSMALLFAWVALTRKSGAPLIRGGGGLALGLGLAALYIVPAAYEQRWVNIGQALASGLQPAQNFLFTTINDPEHNLFNWIASGAAMLLMVVTGIAAIAGQSRTSDAKDEAEEAWRAALLLAGAATILMMRPTLILWALLPKLRFVQFPWRWMSILAVAYGYFLGASIARRKMTWIWLACIAAITLGTGTFLVRQAWWDSEDIPVLRDAIAKDQGFDGTDEYDPAGDDHYSLPEKAARWTVVDAKGEELDTKEIKVGAAEWNAQSRRLNVTASTAARLAVRVLNYPAWRVRVNGIEIKPERAAEFNQMIVPFPNGVSTIEIQLIRTLDRTTGGIISLTSLVFLVIVWGRAHRLPS